MRVLFIFLDGVGLGPDNPQTNPFSRAKMPNLMHQLGGVRLLAGCALADGPRAALRPIDPNLQVTGLPQSATGQATLLTGCNVPAQLGYHYGPKPNRDVAAVVCQDNLFKRVVATGKRAALVNAYPPGYFHGIESGKRIYSSIPLAVTSAGLSLFTKDDFYAGEAMSADFTGDGWRRMSGFGDGPVLSPANAGQKLAALAERYDYSMFEYWASDYAGHHQDMDEALRQMEVFDEVLGGLLESWRDEMGLILVTSDHGNMEDLSTRRHTANPVPLLLFGSRQARSLFDDVTDLAGITPAIERVLGWQ